MSLKFLSVCSGIEAASVAFEPLGWEAIGFSEIEPFPSAVLKQRYPGVPNFGDMTKYHEWPDTLRPDILVGGPPCQGFSLAGLRKGMVDPRSRLSLTFVEIAARFRPRWFLYENVPGLLSSEGGADFATLLAAFTGREIPVPTDGWCNSGVIEGIGVAYGVAWRILDAQFAGVPQRRRRVFIVGYLGDWRRAAAVLLERESLRGDSPPSREKREVVAALTANGVGACGAGDNQGQSGHLIASTGNVPHCLNAGACGRLDYETETFVTHALTGEGFDASEDGTGRGTPLVPVCFRSEMGGNDGGVYSDGTTATMTEAPLAIAFSCKDYGSDVGDTSPTLRAMGHGESHANGGGQVAVAFAQNTRDEVRLVGGDGQIVGAQPGMKQQSYVVFNLRGREGGAMPEVDPDNLISQRAASGGSSRSYLAFAENSRGELRFEDGDGKISGALSTGGGKPGQGIPSVAFTIHGTDKTASVASPTEIAGCIRTKPPGSIENSSTTVAMNSSGVRRITPTEAERLQGFPDGWTAIEWRGKPASECPDGPRYKALGNSWAVPCVQWIGERINLVESMNQ